MLISKELLEKAIINFPKWMDIRKRYFNSNGGKLLSSISDTIEDIQNEINNFIKEFFISYYEDKCNIIPDFLYKINIGSIDINDISLIEPNYDITTEISLFYSDNNYAYYNDGYLFIKDNLKEISYKYTNIMFCSNTEKHHVWNIYDEFALFINIERYQNETNSELYNRIISTANGIINSSFSGLKKSILSSLVNIVPELNEEDIMLERPTAENLVKYYDDNKTIIKRLSELNHDVLKDKIWDKDKWEYDFKKVDYLPNEWDAAINYYKNGIGDNDDLKVELVNINKPTDATINFYSMSEDIISEYIRNANINYNLILKAQKYNNILNELKAKYRITASEIIKLSTDEIENIKFDLYKNISGKHIRTIDDLIVKENGINDIYKIRQGELQKDYYYKLKFIPKDYDKPMVISKLFLEKKDGSIIDYMIPDGNFVLKNQRLYNNKVKAFANEKSNFLTTINAADTSEGIKANNIAEYTKLEYDLTGLNNNAILVNYECNLTDIYSDDIKCSNFYYDNINGIYKSDTVDDEKNIEINIEANKIYIEISQGQCNITMLLDDKVIYNGLPYSNNNKTYFETKEYSSPQKMQIIIAAIGDTMLIISKLKFSKYIFNMELEYENFIENDGILYLPNNYENILKINFRTFTQNSVILNNIFIGEKLNDSDEYISPLIHAEEYDNLIIDSTCKVELYKSANEFSICSKHNDDISYVENYKTNNIYVASSNNSYLILNTSEYNEINNIYIENGIYEIIGNNECQRHIIYLKLGEKISEITIEGTYNELTKELTLKELLQNKILNFNPYNNEKDIVNDEIFINKITKNFVLKRANEESCFSLYYSDFTDYVTEIDTIKILNIPENIESAFVINSSNSNIIINNECNNAFHELYFYPKYSKQYIAINEYITCLEYADNIEILNTFNNGYKDDILMIYTIEPLLDNLDVKFSNGKDWSIGKRNINIKFNIDYLNNNTFNYTQRIINENIMLENVVSLNNYYIADNKENIELAQYTLLNNDDDFDIIYNFDENNPDYEKAEYIDIYDNNKFNKLRYSNVFKIKYIGPTINNTNDELNPIDESKYTVINDKGIIVWNDISVTNQYNKLYVIYTIKKAIAVKFNIDLLYKKVNYNINSYKKLFSFNLKDLDDNTIFNLESPQKEYLASTDKGLLDDIAKYYSSDVYIIVECSNPNFKAEINNNLITFKKIKENNAIAVKNGWYYLNDKEYYLFASNNIRNINIDNFVDFNEIEKTNGNFYFHKKISNFLSNSKMTIDSFAEVYHINNFKKLKSLEGVSKVNELTACENYNKWFVFAMDLSLKNGVNGLGIYFTSINPDISYAYIEITDYLYDISYISFFCESSLKCYIGINKTNNIVNSDIDIIDNLDLIDKEDDIFKYYKLNRNKLYKYYLVVTGTGLLDDLIIKDSYDINYHKKNLDVLGFSISERMLPDTVKKLYINNSKGHKNNNTEVNSNEFIINSSKIDWNLTKIYKFNKKDDWLNNTILENVGIETLNDMSHVIYTKNDYGTVSVKPIYIDNYNIVNKIYYKINTIPLSKLKGISSQLYLGKTSKDVTLKADMQYKNNSQFNCISDIYSPYFKLVINIAPNKYINDIEIFIEYKSTDLNYPIEVDYENGYFISSILDTYEENNYKLCLIDIDKESNNFNLYIRGAKEGSKNDVWTDWEQIVLDEDFNIQNNIVFYNYRFFQLKVELAGRNAKAKINYIDLKVV